MAPKSQRVHVSGPSLAAMAREITDNGRDMLTVLDKLARSEDVRPADRIAAATALLDRSHGKAVDISLTAQLDASRAPEAAGALSLAALEALALATLPGSESVSFTGPVRALERVPAVSPLSEGAPEPAKVP